MSSCYSGFEDRSFEFDDSSFDSGYEKSFETDCNVTPRRLFFDAAADLAGAGNPNAADISVSTFNGLLDTSSNHSCRSARTLVDHVISKVPPLMDKDVDSDSFTPSETSTPTKGDGMEPRPKRKYAVGKNRVTRSRSPLQVMRIKKFRRMKANDRERNRMHMLNDALERLRITLPSLPEETKLTKIEVLRFAYNYIYALEQVLESGGSINLDLEKLQNFTLSGERITKELFDALFVNPQPYPTILGMGMVSYAMAARLPYGSVGGPHTHCQTPYQAHATYQEDYNQPHPSNQELQSTNARHHHGTEQGAYEQNYYDHAVYGANTVIQSNTSTSAHRMDNTHFSAEKYELFKQTFETAANIVRGPDAGSTGYITNNYSSLDTGYAQLTPSDVYGTSRSAGVNTMHSHIVKSEAQNNNNHNNNNDIPKTPTALHQQSSFYSQTPPWKDYNEQLTNTNNRNFDAYTATGV